MSANIKPVDLSEKLTKLGRLQVSLANDRLTQGQRDAIQSEYDAIEAEIAEWNGKMSAQSDKDFPTPH